VPFFEGKICVQDGEYEYPEKFLVFARNAEDADRKLGIYARWNYYLSKEQEVEDLLYEDGTRSISICNARELTESPEEWKRRFLEEHILSDMSIYEKELTS
jgi:hypothetical protein